MLLVIVLFVVFLFGAVLSKNTLISVLCFFGALACFLIIMWQVFGTATQRLLGI